MNACTGSKALQEWDGITVDVKSDNTVETSQQMTGEEGGLQRLDITISNRGTEIVALESIEIRIPFNETLTSDMDIVYGSSGMGQRPVLIHKVDENQEKSYSYMYAMIKMDVDQYVFAGSLSWRIFIPTFMQEDNAFVIRSSGEGKQLKPGESIHYRC